MEDTKNNSKDADPNLEIQKRLLSMKQLLKHKERSLSKYNKALKSRDHVRNSVLRKNFENSFNVNGIESADDSSNNEDTNSNEGQMFTIEEGVRPSKIIKMDEINTGKVKSTENLNKVSKKDTNSRISTHSESLDANILEIPNAKEKRIHKFINKDADISKNIEPCNSLSSITIDHQSSNDSTSNSEQKNESKSTTPVLQRKRLRNDTFIKKRHVKRLFQNNNNENSGKCFLKEDCISGNCEQSYRNFSNTCEQNKEKLFMFSALDKSELNFVKDNSYTRELNGIIETNMHSNNLSDKKPIIIHKDNSLNEASENDILDCCLALPEEGSPFAFVLYSGKYSVWNLRQSGNSENLIWKKCHDEENLLLQDLKIRKFCSLGECSSSKGFVYYFVIKAPEEVGSQFHIIFFSFSAEEKLKTIQKSFSVGCPDCIFSGRGLQEWAFLFSISCDNPLCPNSADCGFTTVTFDVKYSQKKREWELELEFSEKRQPVGECPLRFLNLLYCVDRALDLSWVHVNILWQDSSGNLGVVDPSGGVSFPILGIDSTSELRNSLSSSFIVYAAVVKELLFLIWKLEENLEFVAVDPLSSQFDVLYKIKLKDLDMRSKNPFSVIFYKNKFLVFSATAEIRVLVL